MPSTTTTPNERQFSSNPHDWLFGQVKGGSASHFDDVYGDYYIGPRKPLVVCPPPPPVVMVAAVVVEVMGSADENAHT